jgi:hypothetical protein
VTDIFATMTDPAMNTNAVISSLESADVREPDDDRLFEAQRSCAIKYA